MEALLRLKEARGDVALGGMLLGWSRRGYGGMSRRAEWYRRRDAARAQSYSTITLSAYLLTYSLSFCCINYRFLLGW